MAKYPAFIPRGSRSKAVAVALSRVDLFDAAFALFARFVLAILALSLFLLAKPAHAALSRCEALFHEDSKITVLEEIVALRMTIDQRIAIGEDPAQTKILYRHYQERYQQAMKIGLAVERIPEMARARAARDAEKMDPTGRERDFLPFKEASRIAGDAPVKIAAISPDGRFAATVVVDKSEVRVVDVLTGDIKLKLDLPRLTGGSLFDRASAIEWSSDGHRIVMADGESVTTWDSATGKKLDEQRGFRFAISPDSSMLAVVRDHRYITLVELGTGKQLQNTITMLGSAAEMAISHDGKTLVSASGGHLSVIDVVSGRVTKTMKIHEDSILSMQFTADDTRIATASHDKTIAFTELDSGRSIVIPAHKQMVEAIALAAGETQLVSRSKDHTGALYEISSGLELGRVTSGSQELLAITLVDKLTMRGITEDGSIVTWTR